MRRGDEVDECVADLVRAGVGVGVGLGFGLGLGLGLEFAEEVPVLLAEEMCRLMQG